MHLKEPLAVTATYGLFGIQWTSRLERGVYWSERTDKLGTYYRGPTGGVSVVGKEDQGFPGQPKTMNGGVFVPHNGADPIYLYWYFSTEPVAPAAPSDKDCGAFRVAREVTTQSASLAPVRLSDTTLDELSQRTVQPVPGTSPRQTAVAGSVGGALGAGIVEALIRADVGKIVMVQPPVKDAVFLGKLRAVLDRQVPVPESASTTGVGEPPVGKQPVAK